MGARFPQAACDVVFFFGRGLSEYVDNGAFDKKTTTNLVVICKL